MANIRDILFFYSKYSANCRNVFTFLERYNVPVSALCVDKKDVRKTVRASSQFQINGVPSIVVIYDDGNGELYEGNRVISFLKQLVEIKNIAAPPKEPAQVEDKNEYDSEDDMDMLDDDDQDMTSQSEKPLTVSQKKMADIKDLAKVMEQQRQGALTQNWGIREEELPKF